jgi:hypothetical protein
METETVTYKVKLTGKALEWYKAGKLSIIDLLADELNIPQTNIEQVN